jgi:hypothetical protein
MPLRSTPCNRGLQLTEVSDRLFKRLNMIHRSIIITIVLTSLLLFAPLSHADNPMTLEDLFIQFQAIDVMAFDANVSVAIMTPVPAECTCVFSASPPSSPINGAYVHRVSGEKYRCDSYLDDTTISEMQTQVAYDGDDYQLLRSDGTLSIRSQDTAQLLAILPNPIVELIQFCYPLTNATNATMVRIKDVVEDEIPSSFFDIEWVTVQDGSRELKRAVFPGGDYEGSEYQHYVYADEATLNQPVRIDRVTSTGNITSAEFFDYIRYDVGEIKAFWPTTIILRGYDPTTHEEAVSITYEITYIELEEPMDDEVFVIDAAYAARVWDDDLEVFLDP